MPLKLASVRSRDDIDEVGDIVSRMTADLTTASTPTTLLHSGYTVLCCGADGSITAPEHGLFDFDTRILSSYQLTIGGQAPALVTSEQPESDKWAAMLHLPRPDGQAEGPRLPQDALEILVDRHVGIGMVESFRLRNLSAEPFKSQLEIALDADFADVNQVGRDTDDGQPGLSRSRDWDTEGRRLVFRCSAEGDGRRFDRALDILVTAASNASPTSAGLAFDLDLAAGGEWSATLGFRSEVDAQYRAGGDAHARRSLQRDAWRARRVRLDGPDRLTEVFHRAADDIFDLRNWELEERFLGRADGAAWVVNAGVPRFTGFFGRDALTSGWQSALLGPRAALGALAVAATTQADGDDPWRDAEPGKMIHEMRRGPLSDLGLSPRDAYYGTQTTPAMFVLALSELWHWTGDTAVLRRYRDAAVRALEWAEKFGDTDGDGFLEYQRRSPGGLRNQGWKDSDEAIRHADGRLAEGPIATVEEQAFYFIALQRMAEILVALDEVDRAEAYLARAEDLRGQWHDAYWMPDEGFYALALDGQKRQVRSITSNPGHALGTGLVPPEHAQSVADRLMSPELFSGWGIRTLSDEHPSYNPFAYHLGAVWPVEQATFALGFKRYGLDDHADRLITAVLEAADGCPERRVPEALSGHPRSTMGRPILYPAANSPQAWSSSAVVQLVQIMLGMYPFAPLGTLGLVRPRLPDWLPEVTISGLRVGRAGVDLRFKRRPDGSAAHEVLSSRGPIVVMTAGPPQAIDDDRSTTDEIKLAALRAMPGRRARAARIALGLEGPS